jgi:RNA processing factor Prp31
MSYYVLFESALGYALFATEEAAGIALDAPSIQEAAGDLSKFGKVVKLKAFVAFRNLQDALENINAISEGLLSDFLKAFLETNLPKVKAGKKSSITLGVADHRIGSAISDALGFPCTHTDPIPELLRGIRLHFSKMHSSIKGDNLAKAQLGLGHSYSRAKVKFNVHRVDNMIIQSICLLDQLDKDINTFSMRIREWYSYHFPELIKIVNDNLLFAKLVHLIKRRTTINEDLLPQIEDITMDSTKTQQILDASKISMGMDISDIDILNIDQFSKRVISLAEYRQSLFTYLQARMQNVAPNLAALVGEQVGARLISHAGSLTNLAKYPASTVQILGAEKALFRALKTRGKTPKYGLLFHSTFIGRANTKNKGRISRYLANKCSIASRIDCFSETVTSAFGAELRDQVEERLKFFETGDVPRKNIDVMHSVIAKLAAAEAASAGKRKADGEEEVDGPKLDKKKKKKSKEAEPVVVEAEPEVEEAAADKKKKKKKAKDE